MLFSNQLIRATTCDFKPIICKTNLRLLQGIISSPPLARSSHKISSPRLNQIAQHLSSSSTTNNNTPPQVTTTTNMASKYTVRKIGAPNTLEHRIYIEKDGVPISPFHDIPLYANEQQTILNMVVEIPRWTNGKLEVS
jgi:inorganic pyrophosphatase